MRNVNNLLHVAQVLWIAFICLAQKVFIPSLRDFKLSKSAPNKSGYLPRLDLDHQPPRFYELVGLVLKGRKPYWHRDVGRWHLRRGNRRILIDKNLDTTAEEIHKALEDVKKRREAVRRELINKAIKLRAS